MSNDLWDYLPSIGDCLSFGYEGVMIHNEHYHSLPGISGTKLKLLEESNLHLDNSHMFDSGHKACYDLGTHVHTLALEPELNNAIVMPVFENKAICGLTLAEQRQDFIESNQNKLIISKEDYDKAARMSENVRAICGDIIENSIIERSLFVEYVPELIIKCRIDAQFGKDDYDLKTFTPTKGDMSEMSIKHHCMAMGYYKSAAFRNVVRQTLGIPTGGSFLIFVSTIPGHMVKVRQIPPSIISEYEDYIHDLLLLRRRYLKNKIDMDIKEILT